MSELIFKILFIGLWVIYILIRAPFDKKYKSVEKLGSEHSSGQKILLILLSLGLFCVPLIWSFTPFLDDFHIQLPFWVRLLGIVLAILSLFYFLWIHRTLGSNWSPVLEIMKEHELITVGPYKLIRHPMYAQIWMWTFAQVFIVSNVIAGFSGVIAWAVVYFVRVPKEEQMMIKAFGDKYRIYMKRTGRILPKLKGAQI